ncbi:MAG: hypothetical protein VXY10_03120 [Candidatus Thermoplasmatota archaeon]|nr:hypothetical protein [Candidatus Thermoplasmatota archaeon]MEC8681101.1 hypothetical protein [Candidatus Thermoplasmatota archaeon]
MGSQPWPVLLTAVLLISLVPASAQPTQEEANAGALLDVMVLSASCLSNESCEAHRPAHLIEYFSADWCEPCQQVSDQLRVYSDPSVVILQHHPSPQDTTFLSDSKLRNDVDYRLMFYPSLVVDGSHLLTGTRQAMDLNLTLENQSNEWSGLEQVRLVNGTLQWNASINGTLAAWLVAPVPHETTGELHPSVAYRRLSASADAGELMLNADSWVDNTSVVVLLEREGVRALNVASLAPTGSLDPNDGGQDLPERQRENRGTLPLLVGLALVLALLPAVLSHVRLLRTKGDVAIPENGSEE